MGDVRQLPLIPLRDLVLFPRSETPIYVGREASLRAIRLAKAQHGGDIAVFTQRQAEHHGPIAASEIHPVGTVAKIVASVEMTDQTIKGMLEGIERVRLTDLQVVDGVTLVTVISEPELDVDLTLEDGEHGAILALLTTWGPDFAPGCERMELQTLANKRDIVSVVTALRTLAAMARIDRPGAERGWETPENTPSPRYRDLKNQAIAHRQRVLEAPSFPQKLARLVDALAFDVACREAAW